MILFEILLKDQLFIAPMETTSFLFFLRKIKRYSVQREIASKKFYSSTAFAINSSAFSTIVTLPQKNGTL